MRVSFGIKQAVVSGGIFAVLLFALVSIDPHVQDRFSELVGNQGVSSFAKSFDELITSLATKAETLG